MTDLVDVLEYKRLEGGMWEVEVRTPLGVYRGVASNATRALAAAVMEYQDERRALAAREDLVE